MKLKLITFLLAASTAATPVQGGPAITAVTQNNAVTVTTEQKSERVSLANPYTITVDNGAVSGSSISAEAATGSSITADNNTTGDDADTDGRFDDTDDGSDNDYVSDVDDDSDDTDDADDYVKDIKNKKKTQKKKSGKSKKAKKSSKKDTHTKYAQSGKTLTKSAGVFYGPNGKETYYNLNMSGVVSIMRNQGNKDKYWVRRDGVKMLGDYIMVAASLDKYDRGDIVETSLGQGIVCDTGGFAKSNRDQFDIAVTW